MKFLYDEKTLRLGTSPDHGGFNRFAICEGGGKNRS